GRRPASRRAPHRGFLGPSGPGLRGRDHGVGDSEPASHGHAVALTGPAAARWLRKERTLLAEYLQAGDSSGRIREAHEHLRAYATGRASLGDATVALDIIAVFEAAGGSAQLLAGEPRRWSSIDLAMAYTCWSVRLLVAAFRADTRPDKHGRTTMDQLARAWLQAFAHGDTEFEPWMGSQVRRMDQGDRSLLGKEFVPLNALVA